MKSKICMRNKFFSVGMLVFLMLFIIACGGSDDSPPVTYNISGAVSGATPAGVTINLTGAATASATTDASGNFSFTGRENGTYTVTPVKAGYTFNPASSVVVVSGANVTSTNFVATPGVSYSISGTVAGAVQAGVTITLSGSTTGTAVTNASGIYSFSGLVNGNYTVTPSLTGYTFTPANLSITVSGANSTGNNFTSVAVPPPATYSISGAVSGATLAGVTINLTGAATTSTTTDAGGNFSITGLANGAYTVTPVKTGYTFTPSSSAVTMSGANVTGKNFVAATGPSTYTISGAVSGAVLSGVTITLSGAGSATTTTNTSGNYSFSGIANGSYTVTPSKAGYTFAPSSSAATVSGANITGKNFVATAVLGTNTASGTYTWNSATGVLALTWTSSNFTCNGPKLGTDTTTGVTITTTTMTLPGGGAETGTDMVFTRSSGTAGDIVGTWTSTESTGNSYTLTSNANGTFSLVGVIVSCGGGGQNPSAQSQHWSNGYYVSLAYDDSPKTATSVSVTGPGITGSKALTYNTGKGSWNNWTSPSTQVNFGTTYPAGLPFTYIFSITDTTTWTATATVSCFQERFATNLSPTGTATGTPTFSWTGIGDSSAIYAVQLSDSTNNLIWDTHNTISGASIVYSGPALASGATYSYLVVVTSSSACGNSNQSSQSFASGSFTYQ